MCRSHDFGETPPEWARSWAATVKVGLFSLDTIPFTCTNFFGSLVPTEGEFYETIASARFALYLLL